jgi:uncharacterized damage-inducible protein DinB
MQVSPEQAKMLAGYILADYEHERATTGKVIAAVPPGQEQYTPDPKSMTALKLAWHIASAELFFLTGVLNAEFKSGESGVPDGVRSGADVVAWYEANLPAAIEAVKAMPGEALVKSVDFFGMMQAPAVAYLSLMLRHGIHHRGQLSAYLRPMGAKVPGIYGPSADTPVK